MYERLIFFYLPLIGTASYIAIHDHHRSVGRSVYLTNNISSNPLIASQKEFLFGPPSSSSATATILPRKTRLNSTSIHPSRRVTDLHIASHHNHHQHHHRPTSIRSILFFHSLPLVEQYNKSNTLLHKHKHTCNPLLVRANSACSLHLFCFLLFPLTPFARAGSECAIIVSERLTTIDSVLANVILVLAAPANSSLFWIWSPWFFHSFVFSLTFNRHSAWISANHGEENSTLLCLFNCGERLIERKRKTRRKTKTLAYEHQSVLI